VGKEQERKTYVKDCAADRLGKTTVTIRDVINEDINISVNNNHNNINNYEYTLLRNPDRGSEEGVLISGKNNKKITTEKKESIGKMRRGPMRKTGQDKTLVRERNMNL